MKILIIGGGIAGCSAAYYLSRDGHDVSLFERDSVASHASGFALGGIIPSFGDLPNNSYEVLSNYSIGLHRDLAEQLTGGNAENLNFKLAADGAIPTGNFGYRYQKSEGGFFFKASLCPFFAETMVTSVGLGFGYSF